MNKLKRACYIGMLAAASLVPQKSSAATLFYLEEFEGDDASVLVTIFDDVNGGVTVWAEVSEAPSNITGDLRGLFFSINPFTSALTFQSQSGGPLTEIVVDEDSVLTLSGGNNINPNPSSSAGFDFAIAIGNPGIGQGDDFQSTSFRILGDISASDFKEVGVRLTSVGPMDGSRTGGSKLFSDAPLSDDPEPIPEPATYMLIATGFIAGAGIRRCRSKLKR